MSVAVVAGLIAEFSSRQQNVFHLAWAGIEHAMKL
jgi:hypothetical protein